jgi:hypothetical protein
MGVGMNYERTNTSLLVGCGWYVRSYCATGAMGIGDSPTCCDGAANAETAVQGLAAIVPLVLQYYVRTKNWILAESTKFFLASWFVVVQRACLA